MADLLIELLSEEIPHSLQAKATKLLADKISSELLQHFDVKLKDQLLTDYEVFYGPRRIAILLKGLPVKTDKITIRKKGPKANLDKEIILSFAKSQGLDDISKLDISKENGSEYYYYSKTSLVRELTEILPKIVVDVIENFTWPKSMRLGFDKFSWIRPLKNILVMLDDKVLEGKINLDPNELVFSSHTYGHRFLGNPKIKLKTASDYESSLFKHKVVVDARKRKKMIEDELAKLGQQEMFELKIDNQKLLNEVCGLVEYPYLLLLDLPKKYLELPFEVMDEVLGSQQKYFFFKYKGKLLYKFLVIANHIGKDKGKTVASGNQKVLRARLDDALFFIKIDRKNKLEENLEKLKNISFYSGLGTVYDRTVRIEGIAKFIATILNRYGYGCCFNELGTICRLAKCDLVTEMVGEFPKLQGVMAGYYASLDGYNKTVTEVLKHQYYNHEDLQKKSVNQDIKLYLLAENFELLMGFFFINELPTGSRDPFALRRAALTLVEILVGLDKKVSLTFIIKHCLNAFDKENYQDPKYESYIAKIINFINTRSKNYFYTLNNGKINKRIVNAVMQLNRDDVNLNYQKIKALSAYLENSNNIVGEEDMDLIYIYRRCANILPRSEKAAKNLASSHVSQEHLETLSEKDLLSYVTILRETLKKDLEKRDLDKAILDICKIKDRLDAFFDENEVNHKDVNICRNRLIILKMIIDCYNLIADFDQII